MRAMQSGSGNSCGKCAIWKEKLARRASFASLASHRAAALWRFYRTPPKDLSRRSRKAQTVSVTIRFFSFRKWGAHMPKSRVQRKINTVIVVRFPQRAGLFGGAHPLAPVPEFFLFLGNQITCPETIGAGE